MASMPAASRFFGVVRAVVVFGGVFVGGCGPEINIVVTRGDSLDESLGIDLLGFVFRVEGSDVPQLAGPFKTDAVPTGFVPVPPDVTFSIDVLGCSADFGCTQEVDLVGRNCVGDLSHGRGEALEIDVILEDALLTNPLCPLEDPDSTDVGFAPAEAAAEGEGE